MWIEEDAGKILDYFGKDFIGLKEKAASPFAKNLGESHSESGKAVKDNYLKFMLKNWWRQGESNPEKANDNKCFAVIYDDLR